MQTVRTEWAPRASCAAGSGRGRRVCASSVSAWATNRKIPLATLPCVPSRGNQCLASSMSNRALTLTPPWQQLRCRCVPGHQNATRDTDACFVRHEPCTRRHLILDGIVPSDRQQQLPHAIARPSTRCSPHASHTFQFTWQRHAILTRARSILYRVTGTSRLRAGRRLARS